MLALDEPLGLIGDLYVWRDHIDPRQFYYAPGSPTLAFAPDGDPEFSCVLWQAIDAGASGTAGALLAFTAELRVSPAAIEDTLTELRMLGVEPVLSPIPLLQARATLASALTAGDDALVEQVLAEVDADLVPSNRATFALATEDPILARLVEALVADSASSPIGVRYELSFAGLRPALHARIHADFQRAFQELAVDFKAGFAYQGVGVKIGIEHATRRLQESGALQVEVTRFSDDAGLKSELDAVLRWFQEELQQRFFKSALHPPATNPDLTRVLAAAAALGTSASRALLDDNLLSGIAERAGVSPDRVRGALSGAQRSGIDQLPIQFQLGFSLRNVDEQELRTETIVLEEARAERRTLAPQGLLLFGEVPGRVRRLDLGTAFPELRLQVRPLGDFEADGIERLIVEVAWPDTDSPTRHESFVFDRSDADPRQFVVWTQGLSGAYRYRVQVHFQPEGPWPGHHLAWSSEWRSADRLELAIHPLAEVPRRALEVSLAPGALDGVTAVDVHVVVDDATHLLHLDGSAPRGVVRRRLDGPGVVTVTPTWRLPDGAVLTGAPVVVEDPAYIVGGPWRSRRRLRVVPMLPPGALDAVVTLTPDEVGVPSRLLTLVSGTTRAESVELASLLPEPPPYRVDVLIVREDGTVFWSEIPASDEPVVVVSDREGAHRRVPVKLLAPPTLAAAGVMAVLVQLLDDDDLEQDRVLWTESSRADGVLLVPATAPFGYRVRVSRYGPDGAVRASDLLTTDAPTLLIPAAPPPAPE